MSEIDCHREITPLKPATPRLQIRCSTYWANWEDTFINFRETDNIMHPTLVLKSKFRNLLHPRKDQKPLDFKSSALPIELTEKMKIMFNLSLSNIIKECNIPCLQYNFTRQKADIKPESRFPEENCWPFPDLATFL